VPVPVEAVGLLHSAECQDAYVSVDQPRVNCTIDVYIYECSVHAGDLMGLTRH
jgi:hypothetical protein